MSALKHTFRRFCLAPTFTAIALMTLALGIGALAQFRNRDSIAGKCCVHFIERRGGLLIRRRLAVRMKKRCDGRSSAGGGFREKPQRFRQGLSRRPSDRGQIISKPSKRSQQRLRIGPRAQIRGPLTRGVLSGGLGLRESDSNIIVQALDRAGISFTR